MKINLEDILPIKRKSSTDWMLPALAGLGVGIVAGISVGILIAPDTGEEMRHRLREGAHRVRTKAGDLAGRAKEQIVSTIEPVHERAS